LRTSSKRSSNNFAGALFAVLVVITLLLFLFPATVIQPFRQQSPGMLAWAMVVRQWGPVLALITMVGALVLAWRLWGRVSIFKRVVVALSLTLACAASVMTRIDYFEWMFHPLTTIGFQPALQTKLDLSQMVLAVRYGNDARAYPIYEMAYHHIVNDVVGGTPIVVTY
jgi:hypothetical protein